MENNINSKDRFWKIAVVILIIAVSVQGIVFYSFIRNQNSVSTLQTQNKESERLTLKPRQQPPGNQQQLAPLPLPKLNVNVGNTPGIRPAITPQRQAVQPYTQSLSPGMNINISQSPFGSGFDIDIRKEIAQMEEMMNRMMTHHPGFAMMNMPSNGLLTNSSGGVTPTVSTDKKGDYIVTLHIPDLDKSQVNAQVTNDILTVSGVQKQEKSRNGRGGRSYFSSYSSFQNSFTLPGPAKSTGIKLDYKGDTLTVKIPRK